MSEEKRVSRRKYAGYAVAGIVIVAGAAAGAYYGTRPPGPPTVVTQTVTQTAPTTVVTTKPSPETTPGTPTVRIISFNQGLMWTKFWDVKTLEPLEPMQKFMKDENINVIVEFADEPTVREKASLDFASHTGRYDITLADTLALIPTYGGGGYLEPLENYWKDYTTPYVSKDDFIPKTLEGCTMGGHLYALPHFTFGATYNYNEMYLNKYGAFVPRTTEEMVESLEILKKGMKTDGTWGKVYPFANRAEPKLSTSLDINAYTWGLGGFWFEKMPDGSTPRERNDIISNKLKPDFMGDFLQGFKYYVDLMRNYASPDAPSWDFSKQIDAWAAERAVVLAPQSVNAFSALTFYAAAEVKPHLKFAPTPSGAKGRLVQEYWSMSFGINRDSKDKVAAWKVLNMLTGRFEQKNFAQTLFPTTSLKSVLEDSEVKEYYCFFFRFHHPELIIKQPFVERIFFD